MELKFSVILLQILTFKCFFFQSGIKWFGLVTLSLTLTKIITIYFAGVLLGMFMMLHKSLQQKLQRNLLMELIELNPRATMSLKPGGRDVQNIDLRWILAPIVESGNCWFWGWHEMLWHFFGFYFSFVRGTKTFFSSRWKILQYSPYLGHLGWWLFFPIWN